MDGERAGSLRQVFAQALPLLEGARAVGDPIAVLPTPYHLIWAHALVADLDSAPPASRWSPLPVPRCHCPRRGWTASRRPGRSRPAGE
jgi:hypothetical protein